MALRNMVTMIAEMEGSLLFAGATLAIVLTISTIVRITSSSSSFSQMTWPSGPKKLPIIGNLLQLRGELLHVTLAKLAKVHGGVMTIWMGSWVPIIVISDINSAWEVLVNKSVDYGAREVTYLHELLRDSAMHPHSISSSDVGPLWHNIRKGLQSGALNPLSVASQTQHRERDMKRVVHEMSIEIANNNDTIKPLDHIKNSTARLLGRLIFGPSFNDNKFIESMLYEIEDFIRTSSYTFLTNSFYYAKYLPSQRKATREAKLGKYRIEELVRPLLSSKPPTNAYLYFLLSQNLSEEVTIFCIFELFLLGVDSASSTTTWALAYMIREQEAQEKLYQDIRMTIGDVDLVKIEDVNKLKYLQAVVKETMRMKPIAPLALPHNAGKDTTLMGTKIVKGTRVMVNLYALHHNEDIWLEPYKFMPERYLQGEDGGVTHKAMEQSFLPFGAGMRICAGMDLGKHQVAFVLANLVNAFKWSCVEDDKLPDMTEELFALIILMKTPLEGRISPRTV
ncbi:hypothetical protein IFM89_030134 [Coptis chinensis]|uniref:(S)-canadine synthase n=1 Tax=Coptis chinensis TaxID=261450 RepID=A0A835I2C9_9MAGN|nr:hypothetical protein IFM89_030134 [Coptis chinensis]